MANRKLPPDALKEMREQMSRVQNLVQQQNYPEAKALALKVDARCAYFGVQSAHVAWALAVIHDYAGEVEVAFKYIQVAIKADPLETTVVHSFDVIATRLRRMLIDPDRDPADESVPRLHSMLVEAGMADEVVHLALARHLAEVGNDDEAMKLVEAVARLWPACCDAWLMKATLARKLGLSEEAVMAEAEAAACDGGLLPVFGIPGQAVA